MNCFEVIIMKNDTFMKHQSVFIYLVPLDINHANQIITIQTKPGEKNGNPRENRFSLKFHRNSVESSVIASTQRNTEKSGVLTS